MFQSKEDKGPKYNVVGSHYQSFLGFLNQFFQIFKVPGPVFLGFLRVSLGSQFSGFLGSEVAVPRFSRVPLEFHQIPGFRFSGFCRVPLLSHQGPGFPILVGSCQGPTRIPDPGFPACQNIVINVKNFVTKERHCTKVKVKKPITFMFAHFLISLVCRFICNLNYNHDKGIDIEQNLFANFAKSCSNIDYESNLIRKITIKLLAYNIARP